MPFRNQARPDWRRVRRHRWIYIVVVGLLVQACSPLPRRPPVPVELTERASIPGIPGARYRLDGDLTPYIQGVVLQNFEREQVDWKRRGVTRPPPLQMLAISGGGDAGAFAAGILCGWTARGTRPEFRVVTGTSAGALIAPFAFLGPAYDEVIRSVSVTIGPDDVFRSRNTVTGLMGDGMAESEPLRRLIERHVTPEVLAAIARERTRGRNLQIATTDLDAGRAVTWDMTAIAASAAPGALELFRSIMLASTSVPGAVSPVMIDVEADGRRFQEMHVDGGVIAQLFLYPPRILAELERATGKPFQREVRAYLIRNRRLTPMWNDTPRRTADITGRAINTLVQQQGIGDVYRLYKTARRDSVDFNLAYIAEDFDAAHKYEFESAYMNRLFQYAFDLAANGDPWRKTPPGE